MLIMCFSNTLYIGYIDTAPVTRSILPGLGLLLLMLVKYHLYGLFGWAKRGKTVVYSL